MIELLSLYFKQGRVGRSSKMKAKNNRNWLWYSEMFRKR